MPLIEVEVVADDELSPTLAPRLAEAAGRALDAPAGQTWVRLRRLATASYAESGGGPPAGVRPVFVQVLQARLPDEAALARQAAALSAAIAEVCGRPADHVHVVFSPEGAGRIAFGGRLPRGDERR